MSSRGAKFTENTSSVSACAEALLLSAATMPWKEKGRCLNKVSETFVAFVYQQDNPRTGQEK